MPTVYLSEEICARARDKLQALLEASDSRGTMIQHRAADSLLRACQTQARYGLHPQGPADYQRALGKPHSMAQQLAAMTEDELLQRQAELTADYPGRSQKVPRLHCP
jgi:hypothetical protein